MRKCETCGNPDRGTWEDTCRWAEVDPEAAAAGGIPPCAVDEYLMYQKRLSVQRCVVLTILVCALLAPALQAFMMWAS